MLENIHFKTTEFAKRTSKNSRKKIGQFFTSPSVARFMGSLFTISKTKLKVCDAGAGSGILATALCESILKDKAIEEVEIDLYENDLEIIPLLKENMELVKEEFDNIGKILNFNIIEDNFILKNLDYWNQNSELKEEDLYDVIISNPPYKKLKKDEVESVSMASIVHGQPNIYFLFMAMAAKLLKEDGEMIFITPRSFTSGAYFRKFREWFFNNMKITNLHLFISRSDVFDSEKVLQETIITKAIKTKDAQDIISITESQDSLIESFQENKVTYSSIVSTNSDNYYMLIPTTESDFRAMSMMSSWSSSLLDLGYKLKTGPVVDFRALELLKEEEKENTVPLIWAHNLRNQRIEYPIFKDGKPQFILNTASSKKLLLENKDYLILKRFTSKEERRRIQPAIHFSEKFKFDSIGIENHLNYIVKEKGEFSKEEIFGLFTILNTSFMDRYYRILNGSTQVNATEMNTIPMPDKDKLVDIGKLSLLEECLDVAKCDQIVSKVCSDERLKVVI